MTRIATWMSKLPPIDTSIVPFSLNTPVFNNYAANESSFSAPALEQLVSLKHELESFLKAAEIRRQFLMKNLSLMQNWMTVQFPVKPIESQSEGKLHFSMVDACISRCTGTIGCV